MQSRSSSVVVFRALVMLGCLAAILLAALFGSALPDLAKGLFDGRLSSISAFFTEQSSGSAQPDTPGFASTDVTPPHVVLGELMPTGGGPQGALDQQAPGATGTWNQSAIDSAASSAVVPAAYETPTGVPPAQAVDHSAPRELHQPLSDARRIRPIMDESTTDASPASNASPHIDRFSHIQNRLRELGATYYLLETFGTQNLYRFYCRMAIGGNPTFMKCFEATDPDPLKAMGKVLQEVEGWCAGRLP